MSKKKKNSLRNIRNLDATAFLKRYYGITHDNIENMTHDVMKSFFPQLQRTSFEYVQKNPELISTGQIIMVEDAKHYQIPYFTPAASSMEDSNLGLDEREQVIRKIVETLGTSILENLQTLFIIEGEDSLTPFAYQAKKLTSHLLDNSFMRDMVEATNHDSGIIIKEDYSLMSYRVLSHGDNYYDTMILPPLQRQAVGISKRTDAIGVFYDNGVLGIVLEGMIKELSSKEELQKELMAIFPIQKRKEQEQTVTAIVCSPNSYALKEMSVYELEQLMRVYKLSNQTAYYHVVRRELIRRTKAGKEFRLSKEKQRQKSLGGEE